MVLINSYGGDTYAAFGLVDVIKNCISPVITCCIGIAHSSGSIILAAGNQRYALPNSSIMIHEHTITFNNSIKHSDMVNEVEAGKRTFKTLEDYYVNVTNQSRTKINKLLKKDSYMSSQEAKDMNLIDGITWDIHNWLK